ncbi:EmrB/QacA subfamily drug resistance transporter [Silvibacterium bohemicum]|uniref:EmrB/QacA subfamily drug resistance transporter n=1 Tax=Silvibacterium bohemicum TaxID=1577686 RepID=A0A841JWT2_9BACT|nr:MFS transporter [Silvibacterium bohemicum]MBB6144179.1 EmrB/QacA subfamily drug resistance transporter [Silvibacterium bohemicum]
MKTRSPFLVTSLVAAAMFMELLDGTIIATALPQMARAFHASAVSLNVGMTAYMLTLAVFIPISGWMADRMGSRTVFAAAIMVFTLASILCGFSNNVTEFVLARIVQGVGGAMMVPVGRLIVLRATPKEDLGKAIAYITWPALSAPVIGPPLGGFITTYWSWRWIFFLNVPLGIIALGLTLAWITNEFSEAKHRFDWRTFVFAGIASTLFVYALEALSKDHTDVPLALILMAISIGAGVIAVLTARHAEFPLIDLISLKLPSYAQSIYGGSLFRIAVSVLPFLLPLMFQIGFGLNAFHAGLYLLILFAGDLSMKAAVIPVLRRFGFRQVLLVNGVMAAVSVALCATLTPHMPIAIIAVVLFAHGALRSMQFTSIGTLAYADIPPAHMSRANGFFSAVVQLSGSMGIAIGAALVRASGWLRGHHTNPPALRDFHFAILAVSGLVLLSLIDALRLAPDAGAVASGHRMHLRASAVVAE